MPGLPPDYAIYYKHSTKKAFVSRNSQPVQNIAVAIYDEVVSTPITPPLPPIFIQLQDSDFLPLDFNVVLLHDEDSLFLVAKSYYCSKNSTIWKRYTLEAIDVIRLGDAKIHSPFKIAIHHWLFNAP
jgi:hypothetical protein